MVLNHLRRGSRSAGAKDAGVGLSADARDLFDGAPIGYIEIDRKGVVRRVNRRQCKLLGLDEPELIGKPCAHLVPTPERERFQEQLNLKMAGEIAVSPHLRDFIRPDGTTAALEIHEQLLEDAGGRVRGMRLAALDVSDRKQSEQKAYQAAAALQALFQAFPDLFLRVDRDGNVLDAKGGQSSDPFLACAHFAGRKLDQILPAGAMAEMRVAQERVRKTRSMEIIEFSIEGQSSSKSYEARLLPLEWEQWIAVLRNITGRKEDENKLKEYSQELERKNEELEAALVTAREATRMKSRFLANMSHEIRTPMNGVIGMTDFLMGTALDEEQKEYAVAIQRSARSLLVLINDILDLSRIEAGKLRVDRVLFPLRKLVDETASLFALQARGKGIEFTCEIDDGLAVTVASDPERLRQVLTNLLGNAIKFTEEGRIGVKASIIGETLETIRARFVVHDTGIGIDKSMHEKIFESFTQADTSSSRKYGGTGLGLAISKQIVDLLGGDIGVESELGRGSRFWFTAAFGRPTPGEDAPAPRQRTRTVATPSTPPVMKPFPPAPAERVTLNAPAVTPRPAAKPPDKPAPAASAGSGASTRILLAEDNEINQRITLRLLEKLGFAADAVTNGQQAAEAAEKKKYDLILMDCQMPVMDGFEATAVIRHHEGSARHTPICALTANAMEGDREKCLAAGMDEYMTKPVGIDKLREAVHRWVRRDTGATVSGA